MKKENYQAITSSFLWDSQKKKKKFSMSNHALKALKEAAKFIN